MSLSQAIDALLAHVPDDGIIPYGSERRRQFDVLDRAVWIEACKLSLEEKLPPEESDRPSLGLTHLPGGGYVNGDFAPTGLRWWTNRLLALRALAESVGTPEAEREAEQPAKPKSAGMTVPEAADKLERLRSQGQPWTSYGKLSKQFGCSSKTLHDAVRTSPALQAWATRPGAVPRAQSLTPVVTGGTPQSRELDPMDEVAIREYVEKADPETRAWFLAQSVENQLTILNDPDKDERILGRRP